MRWMTWAAFQRPYVASILDVVVVAGGRGDDGGGGRPGRPARHLRAPDRRRRPARQGHCKHALKPRSDVPA